MSFGVIICSHNILLTINFQDNTLLSIWLSVQYSFYDI